MAKKCLKGSESDFSNPAYEKANSPCRQVVLTRLLVAKGIITQEDFAEMVRGVNGKMKRDRE